MQTIRSTWGTAWRSLLVAAGYVAGLMLAGMIGAFLGAQLGSGAGRQTDFLWLMISNLLLGVLLGPIAARLRLSRLQHFVLWGSLIFFNMGSVAIEGAYFVPELVPVPIPVLFAQQALASAVAALVITLLFGVIGQRQSLWLEALRTRPWISWLWRFALSALSYMVFYFIFGALNFSLVTKPYYDAHAGGLMAPAPGIVLMAESVRAPLIVLSVFFFLLSVRGSRRDLVLRTGWLLFAVGGIVPLVLQVAALPLPLLAASAVEIFFQNFLTGAVAALLLGISNRAEPASD